MGKLFFFGLFLLLLVNIVFAARISGSIYSIDLNKVSNALVEIDTSPKQQYISKNGTYAFNVPVGDYKINAKLISNDVVESFVSENVLVKDNGDYILDLVLFPNLEEEDKLLNDTEIEISDGYFEKRNYLFYYVLGIASFLVIILIFLFLFLFLKKNKKEIKKDDLDDDLKKVIKIIKGDGGRTTQKDIRKKIDLSEGKISLLITELENNGVIEKIKKGRGNIIKLK